MVKYKRLAAGWCASRPYSLSSFLCKIVSSNHVQNLHQRFWRVPLFFFNIKPPFSIYENRLPMFWLLCLSVLWIFFFKLYIFLHTLPFWSQINGFRHLKRWTNFQKSKYWVPSSLKNQVTSIVMGPRAYKACLKVSYRI